jgi:hypothetical protein
VAPIKCHLKAQCVQYSYKGSVFKELNRDYECFKAVVNASDMLNGIDNEHSLVGWRLLILKTEMKDCSPSLSI